MPKSERYILGWHLTTLLVTLLNVPLIFFDLSYFYLRPTLIRQWPGLVAWYDRYKGVHPHWLTNRYRQLADSLTRQWTQTRGQLPPSVLTAFGDSLFYLSLRILSEEPYAPFDLMEYQEGLKYAVKTFLAKTESVNVSDPEAFGRFWNRTTDEEAFRRFWTLTPQNVAGRLALYQQQLRWRLQVCYFRHYASNGEFVDDFWKVDRPFLIFFWVSFFVGWFIHLRFRVYRPNEWWRYPFEYWYEALALIPVESLGFLRLIRVSAVLLLLKIRTLFLKITIVKMISRIRKSEILQPLIKHVEKQQRRTLAKEIANELAQEALEKLKNKVKNGKNINQIEVILAEIGNSVSRLIAAESPHLLRMLRTEPALHKLVTPSVVHVTEKGLPDISGLRGAHFPTQLQEHLQHPTERFLANVETYLASPEGQQKIEQLMRSLVDRLIQRLQEPQVRERLLHHLEQILTTLQKSFEE